MLCFETADSKRVTSRFAEVRNLKEIAANHGVAQSHVFGAMRGLRVRRAGNASVIKEDSTTMI